MRLLATIALDFFLKKYMKPNFTPPKTRSLYCTRLCKAFMVIQYAAKLDSKARMLQKPIALDSVKMGWFSSDRQSILLSSAMIRTGSWYSALGKAREISRSSAPFFLDNSLNILVKSNPYIENNEDLNLGPALFGKQWQLIPFNLLADRALELFSSCHGSSCTSYCLMLEQI